MRRIAAGLIVAAGVSAASPAFGGVIFGTNGNLGGGFRWDAGPRTIGGNERSLVGGLRFSVQGGSYEAYRDLFSWNTLPSVSSFTTAVQQAFNAWTIVDPATGLGTALSFVDDIANTVVVGSGAFNGTNAAGAEIDLFGQDAGDGGTRAVAGFFAQSGDVTLTSGTTGYGGADGGGRISGADIKMNSNSGATYSLDLFRRILTHEIGHALGLGDVEDFGQNLGFIDDNYDGSSPTTAADTLNNSWALLVNPLNPEASAGLTQFAPGVVANGNPGLDSPGVNILMESEGVGISAGNPVTNLFPLTNDDFGTRQFLYPEIAAEAVPEPSSFVLAALGGLGWLSRIRRRRNA